MRWAAVVGAVILLAIGLGQLLKHSDASSVEQTDPAPEAVDLTNSSASESNETAKSSTASSAKPRVPDYKPTTPANVAEERQRRSLLTFIKLENDYLNLSLTKQEVLAGIWLEFIQIRAAYETRLIASREVIDGVLTIEIPAYAEAGKTLRSEFEAQIDAALGTSMADRIDDVLGQIIDSRMRYWGRADQTLLVYQTDPLNNGGKQHFYIETHMRSPDPNHLANELAPFPAGVSTNVTLEELHAGLEPVQPEHIESVLTLLPIRYPGK